MSESKRAGVRPASEEEALDPGQCIVDAHHHLYDRPGNRYLLDDLLVDLHSGHDVRATVFVQARAMLRQYGPEAMKPIGETDFASGVASLCEAGAHGPTRACAAIVGFADLTLGEAVRPVLEAHIVAGGGRFRGIRHIAAWDPDPSLLNSVYPTTEDLLSKPAFRAGFAQLAPLGLSFDAWLLYPQLSRLATLARAFPDTQIVLNHCGGVVRTGRHAAWRDEVFTLWSSALRELAACPNVMMKLGGLGMPLSGLSLNKGACRPSSLELAAVWRPWIERCIEVFGPSRCMFESNFPADKVSHSYGVGWNAMKRIATGASDEDKADLFWRRATRFYRLSITEI